MPRRALAAALADKAVSATEGLDKLDREIAAVKLSIAGLVDKIAKDEKLKTGWEAQLKADEAKLKELKALRDDIKVGIDPKPEPTPPVTVA